MDNWIIFGLSATYLEGTTNPAAVDAKAPSPPEALAIPRDVPTGSAKEGEIVFVLKMRLPYDLELRTGSVVPGPTGLSPIRRPIPESSGLVLGHSSGLTSWAFFSAASAAAAAILTARNSCTTS